jgi:uncharacterized phiE125 gp8 family phage protein
MPFRVNIEPSAEPVTLADLKIFCKADLGDDDGLLTDLISVSRKWCERYTRRCFRNTGIVYYTNLLTYSIPLEFPPFYSLDTASYYDNLNNLQSYPTSNFFYASNLEPAILYLKYNALYPALYTIRADAFQIAYTAGYGNSNTVIPDGIKHAIMMLALELWDNRGGSSEKVLKEVPFGIKRMLDVFSWGGEV